VKSKYFSRRAIGLHLAMLVWVAICGLAVVAGRRERSKATLSYLYADRVAGLRRARRARLVRAAQHAEKATAHQEQARREYEEKMRAEPARPARQRRRRRRGPRLEAYNDHLAESPPCRRRSSGDTDGEGFRRYRIMSFVTGTTLLILCCTLILHTVDLTLWKRCRFVAVVGIGHGVVLYPIYLVDVVQHGAEGPAPRGLRCPHDVDRGLRAGPGLLHGAPHASCGSFPTATWLTPASP
jgi:hypothetical protein